MKLYRMMKEVNGKPLVEPSALGLGVRTADRAPFHDVDALLPTDIVSLGKGMSVAPGDPVLLPPLRRPVSLGGRGKHPVWVIDEADLGPILRFRQDATDHGLIEPAGPMTLAEYTVALAATRGRWRIHPC